MTAYGAQWLPCPRSNHVALLRYINFLPTKYCFCYCARNIPPTNNIDGYSIIIGLMEHACSEPKVSADVLILRNNVHQIILLLFQDYYELFMFIWKQGIRTGLCLFKLYVFLFAIAIKCVLLEPSLNVFMFVHYIMHSDINRLQMY